LPAKGCGISWKVTTISNAEERPGVIPLPSVDSPLADREPETGRRYPDRMGCDCWECDEARGVVYMLRNCESIISSQMLALPKMLLKLRSFGFPGAQHIADLILNHLGSNSRPDPDSEENDHDDE
jgi:hypothetical protein